MPVSWAIQWAVPDFPFIHSRRASPSFDWYQIDGRVMAQHTYYYYIRLMAFVQENLGKPAPEG